MSLTLVATGIYLAFMYGLLNCNRAGISVTMAFSFVTIFLAWLYMFFPPSLGNDTWRDIIYSIDILGSGHVPSQVHAAYPVPFVSLQYSICSLVTNVNIRWITAFIGLEYLFTVSLLMLSFSKRFIKPPNKASDSTLDMMPLLTSFIVLLNPLIVTWSLKPIPQAYAVALMLSILFLIFSQKKMWPTYIAVMSLSLAMILSHGGVALWFIVFLSIWLLISFLSKEPKDDSTKLAGNVLKVIVMVTLAYWVYTTVIEVIVSGSLNMWRPLFDLTTGGVVSRTTGIAAPTPWYNIVLSYSSLYITLTYAFVGWSVSREVNRRRDVADAVFIVGTLSITLVFANYIFNPDLDLVRYAGLTTFIILAVLAGIGLNSVYTCGYIGRSLVGIIMAVMILGTVFGGFYTPDYSPLGQPRWLSQVVPPTYGEAKSLEQLAAITKTNLILIDWRAGMVLNYYLIEKALLEKSGTWKPRYRGIEIISTEKNIIITPIGSYGLKVSKRDILNHLNQENAILIYRKNVLENLGLLLGTNEKQLLRALEMKEKVFDSGEVYIFSGSTWL